MAVTPAQTPRRRILLLTPRWPYPVVGGDKLRIWQLARAVAEHHDVTLLTLCANAEEMAAPLPTDGVFSAVHRILQTRWRSWLQVAAALPGRTPLQVAYYANRQFRQAVKRLAPQHDLLWCHLIRMAPYADDIELPCWLEMTDAISMAMERAQQANAIRDIRRLIYGIESRRLRAAEVDTPTRFDLITLVSEIDRQFLFGVQASQPGHLRALVVPNGFGAVVRPLPPLTSRPRGIALIGQMASLPNRDAMWYFVDEVLPKVRQRIADATLHVIGPVPARDHQRLRSRPGVTLHGVLPDLTTGLALCRVGVCPVRMAAGIQNKNLDYMAHGLATVTSFSGLEGLRARDGEHIAVARDTTDWVTKVCDLLENEDVNSRLARAGQALVEAHYQWREVTQPMLAALTDLLANPSDLSR